jgi:cold shock CspA family protein
MSGSVCEQNDLTGVVKWFNNKSGYGFITVLSDGDLKGKDIFSHHSSIVVKSDLYKYLVQGEYVVFNVAKLEKKEHDTSSHEVQALMIKGVMGGDLMCETRHKNRDSTKSNNDGFTRIKRGKKE